MATRQWKAWPKRTADELNSIGGVVGVGGLIIGGAGAVLAAPIVLGAGVFLAAVVVAYASIKGFPEKLVDPELIVGTQLSSIGELSKLSKRIPRVGIVGSSSSGKSTLVEKLMRSTDVPDPTAAVYITILRSGGAKPKVFALIDGAGEEYQQQFSVAEAADLLFIVLDHNEDEVDANIDKSRLVDHDSFIRQLTPFLRGKSFADQFVVLLNKNDNWKQSSQASEFECWGNEVKAALSAVVKGDKIAIRNHSNWDVDCINHFWTEVEEKTK
jgi:predicted GTPase